MKQTFDWLITTHAGAHIVSQVNYVIRISQDLWCENLRKMKTLEGVSRFLKFLLELPPGQIPAQQTGDVASWVK